MANEISKDSKRVPHIVIIGAGLAGISAGIQLKRQLGFENFTIYEKAGSVGGTWRDNTYPGCGCDVPAHWYSLSTDLNPDWESYYVGQPQLRAYWEGLWKKYSLDSKTKLATSVSLAEWDREKQRYKVTVKDEKNGEESVIEAEVVINAIGGFFEPLYPKEFESGLERFKGVTWHAARWRHDVELKGKRVGVIGNGCSAAQFVPEISKDPSVQVINFCRTPQWFVPRGNYKYSALTKWIFRHVPFVMRWYRNLIMARSDLVSLIFRKDNKFWISLAKKEMTRYIRHMAPKEYLDKLTPSYSPGCKRIIVDPNYLKSLHRPNVSLNWDVIEGVVEEGIKLKTGEVVPLDIIIFGTGYALEPQGIETKGSNGNTMREYFEEQGGATAYLGSSMPGFPNFYTLLGPNVATGHASVIFSQEAQINLALQLIKPVVEGKVRYFEVTSEATDKYNVWLQNRLQNSVWTDCMSYYRSDRKFGKIIATFPGPVALFWWLCRTPKWDRYRAVGAETWVEEQRSQRVFRRLVFIFVLSVSASAVYIRA
ncbi:FAD/NAD(P)-binding domain-containing protein [Macrolepiota fuliginosa MF-IS2]|uniref:FAD/NAD(P)-binding domain-containing protein n=1 Tax=Macrolepiota fuliginosa MF-IS2 TaxID=1400762 RepID=A0A9P5XQH5_9AGAR|nr:FAD/NAD(P)-binding domain-containing protein [Macrolepiota fuliginosa MF-IS2]